jgi:cytochrome c oxidase subunit 3
MMVLAVHYAKLGNRRRLTAFLLLTAMFGVAFLMLKGLEYYLDYRDYLIPGWRFNADEWITREGLSAGQVPHVKLFLLMYWIMTITHAVHMIIGISIVLILAVLAHRGNFSAERYAPVDVVGLYWHFVDIVWIFLLPMLYLLGTHTL